MVDRTTFASALAVCLGLGFVQLAIAWVGLLNRPLYQDILQVFGLLLTAAISWLLYDIYKKTAADTSYPLKIHLFIYLCTQILPSFAIRKYHRKFAEDIQNGRKVQETYLLEQLCTNSDTVYGRKYRFSEIKSREDYVRTVPLTRQADMAPYCQRIADGEKNVLTKEDPVMMALTTGTTGANCPFPLVKTALERGTERPMGIMYKAMIENLPGLKKIRKSLFLSFPFTTEKTKGGMVRGPQSDYFFKKSFAVYVYLGCVPKDVFALTSQSERTYLAMLFALADRTLGTFQGSFSLAVYEAMTLVENNWPKMVEEIRTGRLHSGLSIPDDVRAALEKSLQANATRADELDTEFRKGFAGIMKRIWPNMSYIAALSSGAMAMYRDFLDQTYAKDMPICSTYYGCTEGSGGLNLEPLSKTPEYVMLPDSSFYEFIREEDLEEDQPPTLFAEQVEVGKNYELVLTHMNGLCRFRNGDVLKVTRFYHTMPMISLEYRKGQLLNLLNEKTTEVSVLETVRKTVESWEGCALHDYTCAVSPMVEDVTGDKSKPGPYYVFFVELSFKDGNERSITNEEKAVMDATLRSISQGYNNLRSRDSIQAIVTHVVESGSFRQLKDYILQVTSASFNQFKMPRLLKRPELVKFMLTKIKQ